MKRFVAFAVTVWTLCGCGAGGPGYEELLLRDALGADPRVIGAMSEEDRRTLAERFAQEQAAQAEDPGKQRARTDGELEHELRLLDADREAAGADSLLVVALKLAPDATVATPIAMTEALFPLPTIEDAAMVDATAELEQRALKGQAGLVLSRTLAATGTVRIKRVIGWPAAAVASGDTLYVNGAWLTAMSALEKEAAPPAEEVTEELGTKRAALSGNPYSPPSIEQCVSDITQECDACVAVGSCTPHLDDMKAQEQCTFLQADASRIRQLCVLILLNLESVNRCISESQPSCVSGPVNVNSKQLPFAKGFLDDANCVTALEGCTATASTGGTNAGTSGGSSGGGTCAVVPEEAALPRRVFWLLGPLLFTVVLGHRRAWNRRS